MLLFWNIQWKGNLPFGKWNWYVIWVHVIINIESWERRDIQNTNKPPILFLILIFLFPTCYTSVAGSSCSIRSSWFNDGFPSAIINMIDIHLEWPLTNLWTVCTCRTIVLQIRRKFKGINQFKRKSTNQETTRYETDLRKHKKKEWCTYW